MKSLFIIIVVVGIISCESDNVDPKTADFEKFKILIPGEWTASRLQGYDSFVGQIEINDKEKVYFDLGWYANKLNVDSSTHDIHFITIDNKSAKVVKPKNFGQGTTGVYFDSLEASGKNRFEMSGTGLSPDNQKLLLNAIESLRFMN